MEMFSIESDDHDHEFKEGMAWGITMIKPDQDTLSSIQEGYKNDVFFSKIIKALKMKEEDPTYIIPKEMKFTCSKYVWNNVDKLLFKFVVDGAGWKNFVYLSLRHYD